MDDPSPGPGSGMRSRATRTALSALDRLDADRHPTDVLADVHRILRQGAPHDAAFVSVTDPATGLPSTAGIVNLSAETCGAFWDAEHLAPDEPGTFEWMRRTGSGAVTLDRLTDGRPERAQRYRSTYAPDGLHSELRAVLTVDGAGWGVVNLLRGDGEPDFTDAELEFIDAAAPVAADKLRTASVLHGPGGDAGPVVGGTGVVVFDPGGTVVSMTGEARALLGRFASADALASGGELMPPEAYIVVARARAQARGVAGPEPFSRAVVADVRLSLRASTTVRSDGSEGQTVLLVAPARSVEVLPLIVDAYGVTDREAQVLAMLLRGDSPTEIAGRLYISVNTVRVHVRNLYTKLGVTSRGELNRLLVDTVALPSTEFRFEI